MTPTEITGGSCLVTPANDLQRSPTSPCTSRCTRHHSRPCSPTVLQRGTSATPRHAKNSSNTTASSSAKTFVSLCPAASAASTSNNSPPPRLSTDTPDSP